MSKSQKIIWSSEIHIKDWSIDKKEIMEEGENCWGDCEKKHTCEDCQKFFNHITELNGEYLYDEIANLDKELDNVIIAFADLGLWNGRKNGYKFLSNNLNSIFSFSNSGNDEKTWYVDGWNVRCRQAHHDGVNYILFRKLKSNISKEQIESLLYKNNLKLNKQQISQYTESIRPFVARIYGW